MKKEENKYCPMCGAELDLQPGPLHKQDGKTFCNTTHAWNTPLVLRIIFCIRAAVHHFNSQI